MTADPLAAQRADYRALATEARRAKQALRALDESLKDSPLGARLMPLVQLRASQMNGWAFCCALHADQARRAGETQQRLDVLAAWRESPLFDARERAALALTEALTRLGDGHHVDDALYAASRAHLSERELVDVAIAVEATEVWNRLAAGPDTTHRSAARQQPPAPAERDGAPSLSAAVGA